MLPSYLKSSIGKKQIVAVRAALITATDADEIGYLEAIQGDLNKQLKGAQAGINASFEDHTKKLSKWEQAKQALEDGKVVISDRSSISSLVYYAAGIDIGVVSAAMEIGRCLDLAQEIPPDICFICDADLEWSLKTLGERQSRDRIEQFDSEFHRSVSCNFTMCRIKSSRLCAEIRTWPRVVYGLRGGPPDDSTETIHAEIWKCINFEMENR